MGSASNLPPCSLLPFNDCFGTYTWANGDKYVGEWEDDKLYGRGTYTFANGTVKKVSGKMMNSGVQRKCQYIGARGIITTFTSFSCKDTHSRPFNNCGILWQWACGRKTRSETCV